MESPPSLDDQDESVRIAVTALGDMRNARTLSSLQSTPALSTASASTSSEPSSTPNEEIHSPDLFARVSTIPIVNTALRAYEQSKASSRVVKYGAEMMESSVKSISKPVIDRLPVNQLDDFAHRQLDRLGRYGPPRSSSRDGKGKTTERIPSVSSERGRRSWDKDDPGLYNGTSRTPTPGRETDNPDSAQEPNQEQRAVAHRSRWQAVLLEAGGLGAAVSEESMRRLKYCLQWLQYATGHIDAQILILRDFMASLQPSSTSNSSADLVSPQHMRTLNDVKRDVVDTIRQVVDIVSKYAGGALPEPARARVRGFILHLPQRWATASRQTIESSTSTPAASKGRRGSRAPYPSTAEGSSHHSHPNARTVSRPTSPASSRSASAVSSVRVHMRNGSNTTATTASGGVPAGTANQAAQRILTLATESLDMLRGVTGVFKESLDRADAWVERLKVVGIQRQQQHVPTSSSPSADFSGPPSPSYFTSTGSSRPPLSRGSSGYYSSFPPSPLDAPSPAAALGMLSLASTVTSPRSTTLELPEEEDEEDEEDDRIRDGKGYGIDVQSWARSRSVPDDKEQETDVKMDMDA